MATRDDVGELLRAARTIAIVGCSPRPDRDSHRVARYLKEAGYRIVPVNPGVERILDEPVYPDLDAVPGDLELDIVDVFRSPEHVPPIVEAAIGRGAKVVWLQLGCGHPEAEARARAAGLHVVSDRCIKVEHRLRFGTAEG